MCVQKLFVCLGYLCLSGVLEKLKRKILKKIIGNSRPRVNLIFFKKRIYIETAIFCRYIVTVFGAS